MNHNVAIRPIELTDAEAVQRYASDAKVAETTNIPHPYPDNGGRDFVQRAVAAREAGERYAFAIVYNGEVVGAIGVNAINAEAKTAELDYCLSSLHWGKGIGTTAAALAIEFAFNQLGLSTLFSSCLKENIGSAHVLEKNGFERIGEFANEGQHGPKFLGRPMLRYRLQNKGWSTPERL